MCSTPYRGGKSLGSYRRKNEGGKSGQNAGRFRFVRAVYGGVSFKFHWRLSVFQSCPTTSTATTTSYHFCPHLTLKLFVVNNKVIRCHCETDQHRESTRNCG